MPWIADGPADFPDCLLAARARSAGCEAVLALNRKAAKTATHRLLKQGAVGAAQVDRYRVSA